MTIQLNAAGVRYAHALVAEGKVDKDSAWSFSAEDGNALLGSDNDWAAYGRAHLAVNDAEADETKGHWAYPVIKGGKAYRRGVIAAKSRAAQQGDEAIENAAASLLEKIDASGDQKAFRIPGLEIRAAAEFRAKPKDGIIEGYASVFNSPAMIGSWFREQVAPGAFAKTIAAGDDIRALFNHDENHVLGRTTNGSLKLAEDSHGLHFEVQTPDTQFARDLLTSVDRGDINQCSIGFTPEIDEWDETQDPPLRTLKQMKLWDVSPVTFPAFDTTACAARSRQLARPEPVLPARVSPAVLARAAMLREHLDRLIRA